MNARTRVIASVLALILLPGLLAVGEAVAFYRPPPSQRTLLSSGVQREYVLYVPRSYDRRKPTPLVISLHAAGLWGEAQMEISQWNRVADDHGFIVAYPSGEKRRGPRVWRAQAGAGVSRDVRFIADLIDTLSARYNIDARRVYANGLSNGGGMSFALSCTMVDRIAAVGLVSSAQLLDWNWCPDPRPVPMIALHGTADRFTPYRGGKTEIAARAFPDIRDWTAKWARRNGCAPEPVAEMVAQDVAREAYVGCAQDKEVVLYTIRGGGHSWPGAEAIPQWLGGPITDSLDASRELWAFFQRNPRR